MSRWADLPCEILKEILARMVGRHSDTLRFSHVCQSWRSAAEESLQFLPHCLPPRKSPSSSPLPLLMVPSKDGSGYGRFFSVSDQKLVGEFHDMVEPGMWPYWASLGWVLLTNRAEKPYNDLLFVNPLTQCQIELPPLSPLSDDPSRPWQRYFIQKVVLSADPIKDPTNSVLVALLTAGKLCYWKPGQSKWSFLPWRVSYVQDVVHFKGKFYVISPGENVYACDVASVGNTPEVEVEVILEAASSRSYLSYSILRMYLVVSAKEHIIRVERHVRRQRKTGIRTGLVKAFKLDVSIEGSYIWEKMETLEDDLLFLGRNDPFCLSASVFPELKNNAIYFTDDSDLGLLSMGYCGRDSCVYDYNVAKTVPFYWVDNARLSLPWLWIIPKPWN